MEVGLWVGQAQMETLMSKPVSVNTLKLHPDRTVYKYVSPRLTAGANVCVGAFRQSLSISFYFLKIIFQLF